MPASILWETLEWPSSKDQHSRKKCHGRTLYYVWTAKARGIGADGAKQWLENS